MSRSTTTLRLRGSAGPVEAQIHFPPTGHSERLVVAFVDPAIGEQLCSALGATVVAMSPSTEVNVQPLLEWISAHSADLGASSRAIAVTGSGENATRAEQLVTAAALAGWPPLHLLDLETALELHPTSTPPSRGDQQERGTSASGSATPTTASSTNSPRSSPLGTPFSLGARPSRSTPPERSDRTDNTT